MNDTATAKRSFYLSREHFYAMLAAAFAVHLVMAVAWALSPGLKVNKIPVHVLNIKLGSGDLSAMTSMSAGDAPKASTRMAATQPDPVPPPHQNTRAASKAPARKAPDAAQLPAQQHEPPPTALHAGEASKAQSYAPTGSATAAPLAADARPSQYVRSTGDAQGQGAGSAVGNSVDPQAEILHRYTQLISMWINRHKAIFQRAVPAGMKGNIVVRIVIDRMGNIKYFSLDKGMGIPLADNAALDMVRAANPVPPVPADYPGGNMFEFLIPVNYNTTQ